MISRTMGVAAAGTVRSVRAEQARNARLPRLGALVLDLILYGVLSFVVNTVYGVSQVTSGSLPVGSFGVFEYTAVTAVAWPWQLLLALAYYAVPEALFGATAGKRLVGICVVGIDGAPLTIQAVVIRNVLRIVDWLPFLYLLGGSLTMFSANSQRLGDLVAGTTVVLRSEAGDDATRAAGPRALRLAGVLLVVAVLITIAFEYFARPAIIVDGLYNERQMPIRGNGYTLGAPVWSLGRVTYPVTGRQGGSTSSCMGAVTLEWSWFGWHEAGSYYTCDV